MTLAGDLDATACGSIAAMVALISTIDWSPSRQ